MKKCYLTLFGVMCISRMAYAGGTSTPTPTVFPTSIMVSSFTVATGTATVTVQPSTPSTYSAGGYTYLTNLHIEMYATGTLTGNALPVSCITTGLPGNPQYVFPTAMATGNQQTLDMQFANPLQSNQFSVITVSCPGRPSVYWNVEAAYYQSN